MKLSNQNIYNLRGCKNFWWRCQIPLGGANHFWGVRTPHGQKIHAWRALDESLSTMVCYNLIFIQIVRKKAKLYKLHI
jgi:hypothetical protein